MNAILNYRSSTGDVYYSLGISGSGSYYADIDFNSGSDHQKVPTYVDAGNGLLSAYLTVSDGQSFTVNYADTSDNTKYYKSTYTAASGAITASEHNISTTITALS